MNIHKIVLAVLAAAMIAVGATTVTVHADGPDYTQPAQILELLGRINAAEDPQAEWEALPPNAQLALRNVAVDRIVTVHKYGTIPPRVGIPGISSGGVTGLAGTARTRCWYKEQEEVGYFWPFKLWSYHQRVEWCGNGTELTTTPHRSRWGNAHALFWNFRGHIDGSTSGGKGDWSFAASTQGRFEACIPRFVCTTTETPRIRITAYANGTYSE